MISIFKKCLVLSMVFGSYVVAMDLNRSWDADEALNYISDSFSQNYFENQDSISTEQFFQQPQYDQHVYYPPMPAVQQNLVVNNYYYSPLYYVPHSDLPAPVNVHQNTYAGHVRTRDEEESFTPVKKQRLMAAVAITNSQTQGTNYSYINANWAPNNSEPSQVPMIYHTQNNPLVDIVSTSKDIALNKAIQNFKPKLTKTDDVNFVKGLYFDKIVQERRNKFSSVCCGTKLSWDDLSEHIRLKHAVKESGQVTYQCPFPHCSDHIPHTMPFPIASYFASHTMADFLKCPYQACNKKLAPASLKKHFMSCKKIEGTEIFQNQPN